MHIRQFIRDEIADALTGLPTTADRVYKSRVYPLDSSSIPGLCIYTKREDSTPITISRPRTFERELTVTVEIYVKSVTGYDDQIDKICEEIEAALYRASLPDTDFGSVVKDIYVNGVDVNFQDGADQPLASCEMEIRIIYTAQEGSPVI